MRHVELLEHRNLMSISPATETATEPGFEAAIVAPPAQVVDSTAVSDDSTLGLPTAAAAALTTVKDGLWSDPTVWSSGHVPVATDDVVITKNVTIDHAVARQVDVNSGTLTIAGDLQAYGSVVVRSRMVGTQGGIFFHVADDRAFTGTSIAGPDASSPDFRPQDIGLWGLRGSTIDLKGAEVTSWLNAVGAGASVDLGHGVTQQTSFANGKATLASAPVGWRAGDTLLLVNEHGESRLATLDSVTGGVIQYHEQKEHPTDANLIGHTLTADGSNIIASAKIANLTRRLQIVAADVHEGDANHRAHTAFLDGATVHLENVEFRNLGPRGKQGRYPVYFDQGAAVNSQLLGSSIWQDVSDPGNRFVGMRNVQGVTIANNVAFRSRGNGFFMQNDGVYGNSILNNLSVNVTDGEELSLPDSNVSEMSHHYWLRTGNTISGNIAAGGDAIGMLVLASSHNTATLVDNSQFFGTGLFGFWAGTTNVTFNNPVALFNSRAGFASDPAWDVDSHGTVINNPLLLFNGTFDSDYGSQMYLNNSGPVTVNGGVLAGTKAVHTHYHSAFIISQSTIDVDTVLAPTYWEQGATFDKANIRASLLFERAYPNSRYNSPGVVRFVDTIVQIDDEEPELETADYIGDMFQNYPAMPGEVIPNGIELEHLVPASGFIRVTTLPDDERWTQNVWRWTVTPIGQTPEADSWIYQRQSAWEQLAGVGGYPDGFPPGEYAVNLYTEDGVLVRSGFAVVRSGQVSDVVDSLTMPGDANGDNFVDGTDYSIWAANFLRTNATLAQGDFNGDGRVNGADYAIWADHFTPTPAAPPSSLTPAASSAATQSQPSADSMIDTAFAALAATPSIGSDSGSSPTGVAADSVDGYFDSLGSINRLGIRAALSRNQHKLR